MYQSLKIEVMTSGTAAELSNSLRKYAREFEASWRSEKEKRSFLLFYGPPEARKKDIERIARGMPRGMPGIGASAELVLSKQQSEHRWQAVWVTSRYLTPHASIVKVPENLAGDHAPAGRWLDRFISPLPRQYFT